MKREQYTFKPIVSAGQKFIIVMLIMSFTCFFADSNNVSAEIETSFLYHLSDFGGPIPYNWPTISVDVERNEIYVVDKKETNITIFNEQGMEIYHFGDDGSLGSAVDAALDGCNRAVLYHRHLRFSQRPSSPQITNQSYTYAAQQNSTRRRNCGPWFINVEIIHTEAVNRVRYRKRKPQDVVKLRTQIDLRVCTTPAPILWRQHL